jgi:hypothetical protein
MIKLPGITKTGDDPWGYGPNVYLNPSAVVAVEPREHRYHSFRPGQVYSVIHLRSGQSIEVFAGVERVVEAVESGLMQAVGLNAYESPNA